MTDSSWMNTSRILRTLRKLKALRRDAFPYGMDVTEGFRSYYRWEMRTIWCPRSFTKTCLQSTNNNECWNSSFMIPASNYTYHLPLSDIGLQSLPLLLLVSRRACDITFYLKYCTHDEVTWPTDGHVHTLCPCRLVPTVTHSTYGSTFNNTFLDGRVVEVIERVVKRRRHKPLCFLWLMCSDVLQKVLSLSYMKSGRLQTHD